MTAVQKTNASDNDIAAVSQGKSLVGCGLTGRSLFLSTAGKDTVAVDEAFSLYCDIIKILTPHKRIVPVAVPEILI